MVFQSYALYPHLDVAENMSFGLKLAGVSKAERDQRVNQVSEILQLAHLLDRKPKALSGGQRQRVAIGRTLVSQPEVFLLDEPLSNLDAALRVQMRVEISKLHKKLNRTMIYVTHDQIEAMTMAARTLSLSGKPLCCWLYRFAKNEFPTDKSDRGRKRAGTNRITGCKSSQLLDSRLRSRRQHR